MNEAGILLPSAGCLGVALLFGLVAYALPRHRSVVQSKKGSSYSLREMAGELTPAERAAEKRADKDVYNRNARDNAFWTGETEYQDDSRTWRKL